MAPVVTPPPRQEKGRLFIRPSAGGKRVQPAFGRAERTQGEGWRRPQASAVWPYERLNARVLATTPQSTLKRSHKAISKKSRVFFSAVVFFCVSPGALLRVASISASTWRDPYGVAREVAAPAAGAHCPIGHSELCPVGRGQQAHA